MAAQTPIAGSRFDNVNGQFREVVAKFASVADADTFRTGLAIITAANVQSGANKTMGVTWSGGTLTFAVTSGPDTNTSVVVLGY